MGRRLEARGLATSQLQRDRARSTRAAAAHASARARAGGLMGIEQHRTPAGTWRANALAETKEDVFEMRAVMRRWRRPGTER